jgi:hypothetical protein
MLFGEGRMTGTAAAILGLCVLLILLGVVFSARNEP